MSFRFTPGCCCQKGPCVPPCRIVYNGIYTSATGSKTVAQRVAESRMCGDEEGSFWHGFAVIPQAGGYFLIMPTTDPQFCRNSKYNLRSGASNNLIWAFSYSEGERSTPLSINGFSYQTAEHILRTTVNREQSGVTSIPYKYLMFFEYADGRPRPGSRTLDEYRGASDNYLVLDRLDNKYHYNPEIPEPPWLLIYATPYNMEACPFEFAVSGDTEEAWNNAETVRGCGIGDDTFSELRPYYKTLAQCGFQPPRVYADFATDKDAREVDATGTRILNYTTTGTLVQQSLDRLTGKDATDTIKGAHRYGSGRFTLEYFGLRSIADPFFLASYYIDSEGAIYWISGTPGYVKGYVIVGAVPFYEAHEVRFRKRTNDYQAILPVGVYSSNLSKSVEYHVLQLRSLSDAQKETLDSAIAEAIEQGGSLNDTFDFSVVITSTQTYTENVYRFASPSDAPALWSGLEGNGGSESSGKGFIGKCVTEARLYSYAPPLGGYFPFGDSGRTPEGYFPGIGYRHRFPIGKYRVLKPSSDMRMFDTSEYYNLESETRLYQLQLVKRSNDFTWSDFEDLKMATGSASGPPEVYEIPPFTETFDEYVTYNSNERRDGMLVYWEPVHFLGMSDPDHPVPAELLQDDNKYIAFCYCDEASVYQDTYVSGRMSGLRVQGYGVTNIVVRDGGRPFGGFPGGVSLDSQGNRVFYGSYRHTIQGSSSITFGIYGHTLGRLGTGKVIYGQTTRGATHSANISGRCIKSHLGSFRRLTKPGVGDILVPDVKNGSGLNWGNFYALGNFNDSIFDNADVYYYPMVYITGYLRYNPEYGQ